MFNWLNNLLKNLKRLFQSRTRGFEFTATANQYTKLPKRGTKCSACYDFYLPEDVTVKAGCFSKIIPTHIKAYMPKDEVLLLHIRSSVGLKSHVTLANCTGVIDADYHNNPENEGNIGLVLQNNGHRDVVFYKGERIMQGMFVKYGIADEDQTYSNRKGGTGSTGA